MVIFSGCVQLLSQKFCAQFVVVVVAITDVTIFAWKSYFSTHYWKTANALSPSWKEK